MSPSPSLSIAAQAHILDHVDIELRRLPLPVLRDQVAQLAQRQGVTLTSAQVDNVMMRIQAGPVIEDQTRPATPAKRAHRLVPRMAAQTETVLCRGRRTEFFGVWAACVGAMVSVVLANVLAFHPPAHLVTHLHGKAVIPAWYGVLVLCALGVGIALSLLAVRAVLNKRRGMPTASA